jgi:hypothetical protein
VISTGLNILYSFLYRKYINIIITFLTSFFYCPSLICDFPLVWPVFHNIAILVLGLHSIYERKHAPFGFLNLTNFT